MTDDPYIKEAIRRLNEQQSMLAGDAISDIVTVLAQALAADKWEPPADPRVEALAKLVYDRTRPTAFNHWQMRDAKDLAAEILKIADGGA